MIVDIPIVVLILPAQMDTLNQLRHLLMKQNRPLMCMKDEPVVAEVEGELFLLRDAEDLLLLPLDNRARSTILCDCKAALPKCQIIIDYLWEQLNTGIWKDVPCHLRQLYSHISLLKSFGLFCLFSYDDDPKRRNCYLKDAMKSVDLGILLGLPTPDLTEAGQLISHEISRFILAGEIDDIVSVEVSTKKIRLEDNIEKMHSEEHPSISGNSARDIPGDTPWRNWRKPKEVPSLERPSLERFSSESFHPRLPIVLKGCIDHWPALSSWSPSYLARVAGERTVPVELGPNYVHPAWNQKLMAIREFVEHHLLNDDAASQYDEIGYLAQHPLFEQVPQLRADIKVPEYCCLSELNDSEENEEEEPDINAWFGPKGTVSPLHYDPKHNLLAQVVGRKRVILYSDADSTYLHPYEGQLLINTSQVDPEDPKMIERFPDVVSAEPWECEITAGDMLYIPPKWWHHVRSLSTSFSVSFWWK